MQTPTFIVPIHVEALRVSPSNIEKNKTSVYDFSVIGQHPTSGLGNLIAANRFHDAVTDLEPGVHLHWSLPRAYTHGVQNRSNGAVEFPALPNRWLVIRYLKDNAKNKTQLRLWILESDAHGDETQIGNSRTMIPWMDDAGDVQGIEPNFIGRKIDFGGSWSEPNPSAAGLKYLGGRFQAPFGYGETFTAYYQNCANALGLYDDFSDYFANPNQLEINSDFTASYAVIGWVSPLAADECHIVLAQALADYNQITDEKPDFASYIGRIIEEKLEWSLEDYSNLTVDNAGQIQAVMSGMLAGVVWKIPQNQNITYPSAMPSAGGVQVAVGNNTASALSAYLNAVETGAVDSLNGENGVDANLEWLLNALQFNQLHKLAAGDIGIGQLEEFLHGTGFAGAPGGYLWSVRLKMTPGAEDEAAEDVEAALPLYLARTLSELNRMQRSLDAARDEIVSREKQLFFDWTYHITNLDTQVVHGAGSLDDDNSGNFLIDGLLQLYPALLRAGNYVDAAAPAAPYAPQPDNFRILAPSGQIPNLSDYVFNSLGNRPAAQFVQSQLAFGLQADEIGSSHLPNAGDNLSRTLNLLNLFQAGGVQAGEYLTQAAAELSAALVELQAAAGKLDGLAGLAAAKSNVDADQKTLDGYVDATSGVFAGALKYTADPGKAPLPGGQTYQGAIAASTLNALGSWNAPVGAFPGVKAQMDIFSGRNDQPQHLLDIEAAALYLGLAYFYLKSGVPFKCSSAYYLQMAEQTIRDASAAAQTASAALQQSVTALGGQTLSGMAASLRQIVTADMPAIEAAVSAGVDIAGAIARLETVAASLAAVTAAIFSADWQTLRDGIDVSALTVAARLPLAQQTAQWNQFLYGQVSDRYEMTSVPADHFYRPNEPVLLLAEEEGKGSILDDFARNGQAPRLACRLDADIIAASGAVTYPPEITGLAAGLATGIDGLGALIEKLARESYLLSPEFAAAVSAADLQKASTDNENLHYNNLSDVVLNQPPAGLTGKLPYYIAYHWRPDEDPFLPLFIWWEAGYQYSQKFGFNTESYPNDFLGQFELDTYEVDLQPTAAAMSNFNQNPGQPNFFTFHGLISLSNTTTANLCGQIQIYCQTYLNYDPATGPPPAGLPDVDEATKFYEAYQDFKTRHILSQGLSGFNPGLVQRAQELQMPVTIPRSWTSGAGENFPLSEFWPTLFLHDQSASWPVTWNDEAINRDAFSGGSQKVYFNPLRAGFMNVTRVVLVDAFGRFAELKNPDPAVIAETMKSGQPPPADHAVYLAPRLVQPSRLSFDWMSAASPDGIGSFTELNSHPDASPICGWLWPNHLDDSLMLYDATGIPLGSLRTRGTTLHWFPVPGQTTEAGAENRDQMIQYLTGKKANPVFRDFLTKYLYPDASQATDQKFQNVLAMLGKAQQFIVTAAMQEDQALAVLVGQPLVVTQASLALELKGLPAVGLDDRTYPAWNKFGPQFSVGASQYIPYNFENFNQAGIPNVQIPVRVGTAEIQKKDGTKIPYFDDGLAGYFLPDEWDTLYTPAEMNDSPGITSVSDAGAYPLKLLPNGPAAKLTLLMDPRAAVHATTGILPVGAAVIPTDQYAQVLNDLQVTFLAAPVLATAATPAVPLPPEKGFNWSWVEVGSPESPLRPAQGVADAIFPQTPQHLVDGWLKLKKGN